MFRRFFRAGMPLLVAGVLVGCSDHPDVEDSESGPMVGSGPAVDREAPDFGNIEDFFSMDSLTGIGIRTISATVFTSSVANSAKKELTLPNDFNAITQSSASEDAIDVTVNGGGELRVYMVENTGPNSWEVAPNNGTSTVAKVTGGDVYVNLLTENILEDDETNYLAYGLWVYVPTVGLPEIGVFMDSSDDAKFLGDQIERLTGNVMYTGVVGGIYSGSSEVLSFTGDVDLTASFGDVTGSAGTITGSISKLMGIDESVYHGEKVLLTQATIMDGMLGGFFEGDTSAPGISEGEPFTGKWGGQFFGDVSAAHPENAAGTFGIANSANTEVLLGVFYTDFAGPVPE